ncbi:MAG: hypothetical protein KH359_00010 [Clostridiales bacterium]|nr:hypothetical protein [Clostridiales bacterium]
MKNIELLLNRNRIWNGKIKLNNSIIRIEIKDKLFNGRTLKFICQKLNTVHKQYKGLKIPIEFYFYEVVFADKLTFVLFECICYELIYTYGHYVQVFMKVNVKDDIHIAGINSSPLLLLSGTNKKSVKKYLEKFNMDLYRQHYRRVIKCDKKEETNYLGRLYEEIDSFLKPFDVDDDARDSVANVVSELAGNACEHGKSDCLIDIDVAPNYTKIVDDVSDGESYYGINIVVVNLSKVLLGDGVRENILGNEEKINDTRYSKVMEAYHNHSKMFTENYTVEDFCNITTFQHKISGREQENYNGDSTTGGTGLTKLILSLEEMSDAYGCYVVSGNRVIYFYKDMLEYDDDRWIGFNSEKNYISEIPGKNSDGKNVISEALMHMPGTGYNLNFVMKGNSEK